MEGYLKRKFSISPVKGCGVSAGDIVLFNYRDGKSLSGQKSSRA
jgi:hypothetical protein